MARNSKSRMGGATLAVTLLVMAVAAWSCADGNAPIAQFHTIDGSEWAYDTTYVFNASHDTLPEGVNAVEFYVRHTDGYPYSNLYVELSYPTASDSIAADTFNIPIADAYGTWLGRGSGPVKLKTDTLHLRHTPAADADFRVRHVLRVDKLPEVEQIGLAPITPLGL